MITLIPRLPGHRPTHPQPSTRHKHIPTHTHTQVTSLTSTHPYLGIQLTPYQGSPRSLLSIFLLHTHKLRIPLFLQSLQTRTKIHTHADMHPRTLTYMGILTKTSTRKTGSNYHHCLLCTHSTQKKIVRFFSKAQMSRKTKFGFTRGYIRFLSENKQKTRAISLFSQKANGNIPL